ISAGVLAIADPNRLGDPSTNNPDATPMIRLGGGTLKALNNMTISGAYGIHTSGANTGIDANGFTFLYQGKVFTLDGTDVLNISSTNPGGTVQFSGAYAPGSSYRGLKIKSGATFELNGASNDSMLGSE